ncbi:Enoyl-CoA hydratase/carnithine racemase [Colwellia chukchiensis]|uniref:Enoyl-CoA hydratase/carnithine racemase n=1 Tax=Colwellia chukchiensis TaxID=641665 RepID=A0A1H7KLX9_9GAMM|nr:crotonase/enoyl-CoA hydratase family protein [Colwellia chukchiensis]SEK87540.1 Enoyl-CoA hydratase/carnithine racemase [Colwellia chukchiensis]
MTAPRVTVEIINQIAHVKLNRADKLNALDMAMFLAISRTIKKLRKNRKIRAVIVSGNGSDFCSGLDVNAIMKSPMSMLRLLFKALPWRANLAQIVSTGWQSIPVPVICAIQGRCWGGGLQIALGADFRFATPDSSLSIMEGKWGLIPDMGGTIALRELMAIDQAKKLAMSAETFNGEQALALNVVTHVTPSPLAEAQAWAEALLKQSPDALAANKKLYNKSWHGSQGWALFRESYYQIRILMGKNLRRKIYNQSHDAAQHKAFVPRKKW